MRPRSFFRWIPTAIVLWVFGALSALLAVISVWYAIQATQNSPDVARAASIIEGVDFRHLVQLFLHGVITNTLIAALCIFGWHLMRQRTHRALLLGAFVVMFVLFITMFRWLCESLKSGLNSGSWVEPAFIWLPLAYAIIYAYQESRTVPAIHIDANPGINKTSK